MFSAKAEIDPLERERLNIEARRARNEERKHRILHAKTRILGIDTAALSEQIEEKKAREAAEKARGEAYDNQLLENARTLTIIQEEKRMAEKKYSEQLNEYRRQQMAAKGAKAATDASRFQQMADTDTKFLNFDGEDKDKKNRTKEQADQLQQWLTEQIEYQRQSESRSRSDENDYHRIQQEIIALRRSNEEEKERVRKETLKKIQEYNNNLAVLKKTESLRKKEWNEIENDNEISSTLRSQLLNEAGGQGPNPSASFKGFSLSQRQLILDEQSRQQEELRIKRLEKLQEEKEWNTHQEDIRKQLLLYEREKGRNQREKMIALKDEWMTQKKQKNVKDIYEKQFIHNNPITDDFFKQFGTSCR